MNKDNAQQYLPFIKALAEGKTIQVDVVDHEGGYEWVDEQNPSFHHGPECYRIKPDLELIEIWVNEYLDDDQLTFHISRTDADANMGLNRKRVLRFRNTESAIKELMDMKDENKRLVAQIGIANRRAHAHEENYNQMLKRIDSICAVRDKMEHALAAILTGVLTLESARNVAREAINKSSRVI